MSVTFVVVPQWQGSGSPRRLQISDGAAAIRGELRPEALVAAVEATGASLVYIHVDLDVLDPAELRGIGCPEPAGVTAAALVDAIAAVRARFPLAGAGITEFTPWSAAETASDLATIRRILGALTG